MKGNALWSIYDWLKVISPFSSSLGVLVFYVFDVLFQTARQKLEKTP